MSEYPSEGILKKIENWDMTKDNPFELAELICEVWNSNYGSASLTGKKVKTLQLVTGGWSGNEDIIRAIQETMFAKVCWQMSKRGGLYIYKIPGRIK